MFKPVVFVVLLAVAGVRGQITNTTTSSTTTTSPTTTTTTTPPTTSTTTSPTTTTPATTTTTEKPTTTTTTTKPTTTTTPKPGPTPPPMPNFETGHWNYTSPGSSAPCLRAQFAAGFVVPYETNDPNMRVKNASLIVPANALARGNCSSLMLVWPSSNGTNATNYLTLTFDAAAEGNATEKKDFVLRSATATLVNDPAIFVDAADRSSPLGLVFEDFQAFRAPVNNSFRCSSEEKFWANMTTPEVKINNTVVNGHIIFKDVQVQPWVPEKNTGFGAAVTCPMDRELTSDIVPIAVGCALAALVVIVIVAYIIGRRRSRQSGYTSV